MQNFSFDLSKNFYYIVDTSYIAFCSAFSAFNDYVYYNDIEKSQMTPELDPTLDPEFNEILKEKFAYQVTNPVKKFLPFLYDESKFIFSLDCERKNIWRRSFFPEYKLNRDLKDKSKDKFNVGKVFRYIYENILPNFCEMTRLYLHKLRVC